MTKNNNNFPFHTVWIGRKTGVFGDYSEVKPLVNEFSDARFKGFHSYDEAKRAFEMGFQAWRQMEDEKIAKAKRHKAGEPDEDRPALW